MISFRSTRPLRRRYGYGRIVYPKYEVHGVLAGAYKGRDISNRALLTHAIGVNSNGQSAPKTLCGKILFDKLSDLNETDLPSCPICAERLIRLKLKE